MLEVKNKYKQFRFEVHKIKYLLKYSKSTVTVLHLNHFLVLR